MQSPTLPARAPENQGAAARGGPAGIRLGPRSRWAPGKLVEMGRTRDDEDGDEEQEPEAAARGASRRARAARRLRLLLLPLLVLPLLAPAPARATTRFVKSAAGGVEAAEDATRAGMLANNGRCEEGADGGGGGGGVIDARGEIGPAELAALVDAGFIGIHAASAPSPSGRDLTRGPRQGTPDFEVLGSRARGAARRRGRHASQEQPSAALLPGNSASRGRSGVEMTARRGNDIKIVEGEADEDEEDNEEQDDEDDDSVRLSVSEQAYLYDDVFLENGRAITEAHLDATARFRSRVGWDEPSWASLKTQWDHLPGVARRNEHISGLVDADVDLAVFGEPRPAKVRDALQQKLLEFGRGNPIMLNTWGHLGNAFRMLGETHAAIQSFRRALGMNPSDTAVLMHLALVLRNTGYYADAVKVLRHAMTIREPTALHHFVLGSLLLEMGDLETAIANFQATLQRQPEFLPAANKLQELRAPLTGPGTAAALSIGSRSRAGGNAGAPGFDVEGGRAGSYRGLEDLAIAFFGSMVLGLVALFVREVFGKRKRRGG